MHLNTLLKRTNKELKEEKLKELKEEQLFLLEARENLKERFKAFKEKETVYFKIKDRFKKIYPICIGLFFLWILPIIYLVINMGKSPVYFILAIIYLIITFPIMLISILAPTIKFFGFDLPNVITEIKVVLNNNFIIAIIFMENKIVLPILKKVDNDNHFEHGKGVYIVEKSATWLTVGKLSISFYLEGIPNPLKFNFVKYLKEFTELKAKTPEEPLTDYEGKLVDVAFSSENLREFKKNKLFQEFFRDYTNEANKIIMVIAGVFLVVVIIGFLMYIMKG